LKGWKGCVLAKNADDDKGVIERMRVVDEYSMLYGTWDK
jgi:hypothetical protein